MDKDLTEIVCVLDRSGSMASKIQDMVGGLNEFLDKQREVEGRFRFTLALFDTVVETPCVRVDGDLFGGIYHHAETPPEDGLIYKPYQIGGATALHDALVETIDKVGERLAELPESQRPGKVIFVVLTDGEENSSKRYELGDVRQRVEHQQEKYNWDFLFLGVGIDAFAQGTRLGIAQRYTRSFSGDAEGVARSYNYATQTVADLRAQEREGEAGD